MILWLHLHYTVFWSRWLENENDMVNTSQREEEGKISFSIGSMTNPTGCPIGDCKF